MSKHHRHQPPPPPQPQRQATLPTPPPPPAEEVPIHASVALGRVPDGRHVAAILRTQGLKVVSCALLCPPTREQILAEEAWQNASYPVLFHGEKVPTVQGPPLMEGVALRLQKGSEGTSVILSEVEDGALLPFNPKEHVLFTGRKLDAWQELDSYAAHNMLTVSKYQRRRRAAGG